MDKFKLFTGHLVVLIFLILIVPVSAFAKSPNTAEIARRIENLNTVIELRITDEVMEQVTSLFEQKRRDSQTILGRTSLYFPMIENALREKNLPDELKYIAVIESSLMPDVVSHQGAAGIWQFMRGTAELYGLKIDKHIDERKDMVKSTDKALDYLKLLYEGYGNWTLALAAYNCGPGNINKAIKKANGSIDYWEIQKHLPKETQKYIPRFIAASYLMNYYFEHDLQPVEPSDDLKYVATVKVFDKIEFKKISEEFDIEVDLIKWLNPMYKKDFIPQSEGEFFLTLPQQKMYAYIEKYNSYDNLLYKPIALAATEPIEEVIIESRNQIIVQYVSSVINRSHATRDNMKQSDFIQAVNKGMTFESNDKKLLYQLKRKESLSDVAQANNMSITELLAINDLGENDELKPGSFIKISR
ncbi:MAG: transglycosylase SLT domain-containing protein [Saprospiraceae bacterium]|nr:transglycosylase SLT domain-containing protein [Saprospiraceae bacterium]